MLLPSFGIFGHVVSEEKIFRNRPIRNKNRLWWPCQLMDWDRMNNLYRESSIDASYQVSVHLASEEKIFRNRTIRNKNRLWWPCLLMELEQNEYSLQRNAYRRFLPSFGSFGHAVSEKKNFKNQAIRNKNRLWWPCLLMDRDRMSNLYRGPSIDVVSEEKIFRNRPIRNKNRHVC